MDGNCKSITMCHYPVKVDIISPNQAISSTNQETLILGQTKIEWQNYGNS